jgi:broad specificity phosphatase PhoE
MLLFGSADPQFNEDRQFIKLFNRAVKGKWPLTDEIRAKAVKVAERLLDSKSEMSQANALRAIIAIDRVIALREAHELKQHSGEIAAAAAVVNKAIREMSPAEIAAYTDQICNGEPARIENTPENPSESNQPDS